MKATYRGLFQTGDRENPTLCTAWNYSTKRDAVRAAQRMAKYAGYPLPSRDDCSAEIRHDDQVVDDGDTDGGES